MTPRAVITGAAGLIGQYLVKTASRWAPGWDVQGLSRAELELTEMSKVEARIHALKPDLLIHCAALSRTKACEQDPQQARRINVDTTAHLAHLSQDIPFIFLSAGRSSTERPAGTVKRMNRAPSTYMVRQNRKPSGLSCRIHDTRSFGLS